MKRFNLAIAAVAAVCVGFLAGCGGTTPEADKAAIEEINKAWLAAIVAKDAGKISEIYAEDGQMMPPNTAKAVGREAIKKGWEGFLGLPGMALTFETESFHVAKSGDLAVEIQTYKFTTGEGAAAVTDTGKGTVVWTKRNGKWLVLSDMFSSDLPPPPPAPATPAGSETPLSAPIDGAVGPAEGAAPAAPAVEGATPAAAPAPATPAPATPAPAAPAPAKAPGQ